MKSFAQEYIISASVKDVWQVLTDPKIIEKWGAGPAIMDDKLNFEFSLWGGSVHGKNIEIVPQKKLVQEWFGGDWSEPSIVTFTLEKIDNSSTKIYLEHKNLPDNEAEDFKEGWEDYYLGAIEEMFEK